MTLSVVTLFLMSAEIILVSATKPQLIMVVPNIGRCGGGGRGHGRGVCGGRVLNGSITTPTGAMENIITKVLVSFHLSKLKGRSDFVQIVKFCIN